jgi:hypothetical protein
MPVFGIFAYRGWTALTAVLLVVFGRSTPCRAGEKHLEIVLVMDNSSSMAKSDTDFTALAGADLIVGLLRPGDTLHLVSAGAEASVVLSGTGEDHEKFRDALRRLHREASATDTLSVFRLLNDIYMDPEGIEPIVFWFTGRHFTYNVNHPDYYPSESLVEAWMQAQQSDAFAKDPYKVKAFRDIQPRVMERISELVTTEAGKLAGKKVPVNVVIAGKQLESPSGLGKEATALLAGAVGSTGGKILTTSVGGLELMTEILSIFTRTVNAPTQTVEAASIGVRGESFEVFRGCRHLWIAVLFPQLPSQVVFTAEDATTDAARNWPFGKPPGDVFMVEPHVEKGLDYKQKRWFQLPEDPVGYALFSVSDPLPGNYRLEARFDKTVPFTVKVLEDVDLEYGFLESPPNSIPLGMDFVAVAALKHPDGYSYVFNRSFLDELEFKVLVRRIDGSIPDWGAVQEIEASREGETPISITPTEAGTYYLKGKVSHVNGEFVAFMEPFRFDVFPRVPLRFDVRKMEWTSSDGRGWTDLDPPLRLARGVELPPDVNFRIRVDTKGVEGWENLEFRPGESFVIGRDNPEIRFRVRYKDPEAHRLKGGRFKGRIRLSVDEAQKQIVEGGGSWEIPVEGRISAWGVKTMGEKYSWIAYLALIVLILVFLVVEWASRPGFARDLTFHFVDVIGGKQRRWSIPVGRRIKPLVPFLRQRIVVGRGGDAGLYREDVLCVIVPGRGGIRIRPVSAPVVEVEGDGREHEAPLQARLGSHYRVGGDEGRLEFWLTRGDGED